jgi:CO dehydrogenase/acetyl-CoA synthase epsilon subunit
LLLLLELLLLLDKELEDEELPELSTITVKESTSITVISTGSTIDTCTTKEVDEETGEVDLNAKVT